MKSTFKYLSLPRNTDFVFGVTGLDQQFSFLFSIRVDQVGVKGNGRYDGRVQGVGNNLDGGELDVEALGDWSGDNTGDGDGFVARVEDQQLHGLWTAVRRNQAKVNHLLRTVDSRLRGNFNLKRKIEKLRSSGISFDPGIYNMSY